MGNGFKIFLLCLFMFIGFAGCSGAPSVAANEPYIYDVELRIVCIPYDGYRGNYVTCFQLATQKDFDTWVKYHSATVLVRDTE